MRRAFQTPGHVVLDVQLPDGRIDVEAVAGAQETVVELTGPPEDELADLARIECRERDGRYEVEVAVEDRRGFGLRFLIKPSWRLDVRLPAGADLRVSTASADTRARGEYGSIELNSGSGDVEVDRIAAEASLKTASGDLRLESVEGDAEVASASGDVEIARIAGAGRIRSASGDVTLREAGTELTVQTASGDQVIGAVTVGKVTLQSASGDVEVGIRRGSRLWVDAKSMSGDTSSELELDETGAGARDDEGPLVELRATTMSGDIRVVRA
jgi:DUF4097 and DUF4098 domain-containing protein YvlB